MGAASRAAGESRQRPRLLHNAHRWLPGSTCHLACGHGQVALLDVGPEVFDVLRSPCSGDEHDVRIKPVVFPMGDPAPLQLTCGEPQRAPARHGRALSRHDQRRRAIPRNERVRSGDGTSSGILLLSLGAGSGAATSPAGRQRRLGRAGGRGGGTCTGRMGRDLVPASRGEVEGQGVSLGAHPSTAYPSLHGPAEAECCRLQQG